ncbi:MAG: hypothetical protein IKM06_03730, partial [Clostridia bacterium]|nr:hypothetical protein [Clostridia bacterium]
MKKLFALLLILILLTGCSGEKEASADITPTATIESTQNTNAPTPTSTPTLVPDASATHQILFNKPNIQLHGRNWQISNYYFRSQSGVVEKKKSDFDTVEAFDKHIIEQCEQKYSGIVKHLNTHRDEIEAIYVHITLIVAQYCGDHHFAKMDAMITNKELINKWIDAYVNLPIKVNKEYSSVDADVPTGTRNHI